MEVSVVDGAVVVGSVVDVSPVELVVVVPPCPVPPVLVVVGDVVVAVCSGWFVAVGVDDVLVAVAAVVASGVVVLDVAAVVDVAVGVVDVFAGCELLSAWVAGEVVVWVVFAAAGVWWVAARMAASWSPFTHTGEPSDFLAHSSSAVIW